MEIIHSLRLDESTDCQKIFQDKLEGLAETKKLDIVTEILLDSSKVDEKMAEVVHAAWQYLCEHDLWSLRFESLQQYRDLISYCDTVRPILRRFKKSDRAKLSSINTIERNWGSHISHIFSEHWSPKFWSKHLLSLLATMSGYKSKEEAKHLLEDSMRNRPARSRNMRALLPSDVDRALKSFMVMPRNPSTPTSSSCKSPGSVSIETLSDTAATGSSPSPDVGIADGSRASETALVNYCGCSTICLPLNILLDTVFWQPVDATATQLCEWVRDVSWEHICLFHLQRLGSLKVGAHANFLSRDDLIFHIEESLNDQYSGATWKEL